MTGDPFGELGLPGDASAEEVRAARRLLAKQLHPDTGGDSAEMQRVNAAAAEALRRLHDTGADTAGDADPGPGPQADPGSRPAPDWAGVGFDVPSFTVEALPVDTFHALLLAAAQLGTVIDDDPPYRLDVEMAGPPHTWCRLEIAPDAGASTVSLAASVRHRPSLAIETVRDEWVAALNQLDWSQVTEG